MAINPLKGPLDALRAASPVMAKSMPFKVIAASLRATGRLSRGEWFPAQRWEPKMSHNLDLAQRHALDLAQTLMVCVTLFEGDLGYGVVTSDEFDGDPETVLVEYDPFA